MTATDANRFSIRLARQITGRSKVLVHDQCYHGSVDETLADARRRRRASSPRDGIIGPPVDLADDDPGRARSTTSPPSSAALADRDVAAVLVEPALTNVGIVLPGARLPRGAARADPADRHDPDHRRDPHDLRRPRRHDRPRRASSPTCS